MRKLFLFWFLAGILAFSLVGCGGGGGGGGGGSTPGDNLEDPERDQLFLLLDGGGEWGESIGFYLGEVFGFGDIMNDSTSSTAAKTAKDRLIKSFPGHVGGTAITKGFEFNETWSGPDAGGWYTFTAEEIVTPPDGNYTSTYTMRFRYFAASRRLEFQIRETDTNYPGEESGADGYLVFNGDPLGLDPVYPTSFSLHDYYKFPDFENPSATDEIGFKLTGANMNLVTLTSINAIMPAIMVGNINMYFTGIIYGEPAMYDKLMYNVSSSVTGATTDTPTLNVTGSQDADGNPYTSGTVSFNATFDLYEIIQ